MVLIACIGRILQGHAESGKIERACSGLEPVWVTEEKTIRDACRIKLEKRSRYLLRRLTFGGCSPVGLVLSSRLPALAMISSEPSSMSSTMMGV
jgi:hypothetical protein